MSLKVLLYTSETRGLIIYSFTTGAWVSSHLGGGMPTPILLRSLRLEREACCPRIRDPELSVLENQRDCLVDKDKCLEDSQAR